MKVEIDDLRKVPGVGKKTISKAKDIFKDNDYLCEYNEDIHIKENSINYGDCLKLLNGIKDNRIDLIISDLPYGDTNNSWDSIINLDNLWNQYLRVGKKSTPVLLFGQGMFSALLRYSQIDLYKYDWEWNKVLPSGHLNSGRMPLRLHEDINVFYRKQPTYNPQMEIGEKNHSRGDIEDKEYEKNNYGSYDYVENNLGNKKLPKSIIEISKYHASIAIHPTQKPVELYKYLINTYTNKGDIVLDSTSGVGTCCIASLMTDRRYICIEKEEEYYQKSLRWRELVEEDMNYKEGMKEIKYEWRYK